MCVHVCVVCVGARVCQAPWSVWWFVVSVSYAFGCWCVVFWRQASLFTVMLATCTVFRLVWRCLVVCGELGYISEGCIGSSLGAQQQELQQHSYALPRSMPACTCTVCKV